MGGGGGGWQAIIQEKRLIGGRLLYSRKYGNQHAKQNGLMDQENIATIQVDDEKGTKRNKKQIKQTKTQSKMIWLTVWKSFQAVSNTQKCL